jgi:hypothetical protein
VVEKKGISKVVLKTISYQRLQTPPTGKDIKKIR